MADINEIFAAHGLGGAVAANTGSRRQAQLQADQENELKRKQEADKIAQGTRYGGVLGYIQQNVADPLMRGAETLGQIQQNNLKASQQNPGDLLSKIGLGSHSFDGINGNQLAKDTITTGLNFTPLAGVKGATLGAKVLSGAKIGAGAGALQGAANGLGEDPVDALKSTATGAVTGGALGGALGGVAGALTRGKVVGGADVPTVNPTSPTATPTSFLKKVKTTVNRQGQQMEARSGGFATGSKISGSRDLGFGASSDIGAVLDNEGIPAGNPIARQAAAESKLADYGKQIDATLTNGNRTLSPVEKKNISEQIMGSVENAGVDDTVRKHSQELAKNFITQVKDLKDLVKFRRELDQNNISYISNPDAATAAKQQAALGARSAVSDATSEIAPDIKDLNSKYHGLSNANEYLIKGARDVNNANGGIVGRIVNSGPVQSGESITGKVLQRLSGGRKTTTLPDTGPVAPATPMPTLPESGAVGNYIKRTTIPSFATTVSEQPSAQTDQSAAPDGQAPDGQPLDGTDVSGLGQPDSQPAEDPTQGTYSQVNMMADIQRDPKNASTYMALYKELKPESAKAPKPLSAEASKQVAGAKSGLAAIATLANTLSKDPDVAKKNAVGGLLGGLGRGIAGTQQYESARQEIIDAISRSRSGAALTKSEMDNYKRALPSATDSPGAIKAKLRRFQDYFGNIVSSEQSGSPDIESLQ